MILDPTIEAKLLPHQKPAAHRLAQLLLTHDFAVDVSETGVGKTYVAIAVCQALDLRPIVICPKSVIPVWQEVSRFFGIDGLVAWNYEQVRGLKTSLIGQDWRWRLSRDELLIFDEAHRCKAVKSLNSRLMVEAVKQRVKTLALSATLATNPLEMKAVGHGLGLHSIGGAPNFWGWCRRHGCKPNIWGGLIFRGGEPVLKALHQQIFPLRGIRLRRDAIPNFPECLTTAESYDVPKEVAEVYENLRYDLAALEQADIHGEEDNPLTVLLRARQRVELLKVPTFVELVEDGLAEGHSVAVFVNFRATVQHLHDALAKHQPALIIGDQTVENRQHEIDLFQSNARRVIILTMAAGGVGLSLHDVLGGHPRLALISPNYSAIDLIQALGRIHRAGSKSKAIQKIIFAAGTVEQEACDAVKRKLKNLSLLNDGDLQPKLF